MQQTRQCEAANVNANMASADFCNRNHLHSMQINVIYYINMLFQTLIFAILNDRS